MSWNMLILFMCFNVPLFVFFFFLLYLDLRLIKLLLEYTYGLVSKML